MLSDTNIFLRHRSFCNIIARMSEENDDDYIKAGFLEEGKSIDAFTSVRFGSLAPMSIMVKSGGDIYFFMRGIQTWGHGVSYALAGVQPNLVLPGPRTNSYCQQIADLLEPAWLSFRGPPNYVYHFVGHSLGGAVVEILVESLLTAANPMLDDFVTFGSPKPGNRPFAQLPIFKKLVRWINNGDQIPAAMPHAGDAPFAQAILGPVATVDSDFNAQPPGGVLLAPGGVTMPYDGEHPFGGIYELDLVQWINGGDGSKAQAHQIQEYGNQLMLHILPATDATPFKAPAVFEASLPPLTFIQSLQDVEEGMKALTANKPDSGGSMSTTIIPITSRPKIMRMGSQFALKWEGFIVSVHPSRASARIAAKHLVAALRRLQTSVEWSTPNLSSAFANYLAAASSPVGGFRPIPAPLP